MKLGYTFRFVAAVAIRMIFEGQLAILLSDIINAGIRREFEVRIVIYLDIGLDHCGDSLIAIVSIKSCKPKAWRTPIMSPRA